MASAMPHLVNLVFTWWSFT